MTSSLPVYQDILHQAQALQQTLAYQASPEAQIALHQAAQAIQNARRVAVVGIGASYSAAALFVYRLAAAGIPVALEDAAEFLHYTRQAYPPRSVFILVSRSGASTEIVQAVKVLRLQGQLTIGVTNEPGSPLAQQCSMVLPIGGPSDALVSIQTYITSLLALHLLAETVLGIGLAQVLPPLRLMIEYVQQTIDLYQARSPGWFAGLPKDSPLPFRALYWLGRGASLSTVYEAALLTHEMARFPGLAYSAGAFRHGPWEVVDSRVQALIFAPQDQTLSLNLALADDLVRLGGHVCVISGAKSAALNHLSQGVELWPLPGEVLPSHLSPFQEIIPAEFFLYELAVWQNLTPGVFRASTPITLSETGTIAGEHKEPDES